jgi:hypothetical protein
MPSYFHGGPPGMKPGMFILPPEITRAPSCSEYGAAHVHRRDRVYLCTYPEGALIFAAMHPSGKGQVYQVVPIGEVEPDPDWKGPEGGSVQVPRARVVRVFHVTPSVRRAVMRQFLSDGPIAA